MELFRITKTDGALIVEGEVDLAAADELRDALLESAAAGTSVVDASGVTFIDSTGLHVLLTAGRALNGTGPLVVRSPSRAVRRLLSIALPDGTPEIEIR
jgi:anti-sigma B factor antagonist